MGRRPLPSVAEAFLATEGGRWAERLVRLFHHWLEDQQLGLETLRLVHVDQFLHRPSGRPIEVRTLHDYRYKLRRYFDWLRTHGHIDLDIPSRRSMPRRTLPAYAEEFLAGLEPTLRPGTCKHYRGSLYQLHDWLDEQRICIRDLGRQDLKVWFQHLQRKGQAPATRVNIIVAVRVYLRELEDQGILSVHADDLIRRSDLPRLPHYLPRPLPPEADRILKNRLANSESPYQRALLLMRNTGLRVGELAALEYKCVREDSSGHRFLKVPLGKLHSERLVPIDDETYDIARWLQASSDNGRRWLLETVRGCKTRHVHYSKALQEACDGLEISDKMTPHRLRHTYATTLLNAGMSLIGVMKLLGHSDYRMTLRYTEITLETVGKEYFEALTQLEARYRDAIITAKPTELDPDRALTDIIRWVQKRAGSDPEYQRKAKLLANRLRLIRQEVGELT